MFSNILPMLFVGQFLDDFLILVLFMKIQFGGKDHESAHFEEAQELHEYLFIPAVIVDHGG